MKTISLTFILMSISILLSAQSQELTQSIKGKITDADTQTPLPGAYVIIIGSDPLQGAVSDFDGNYKISDVKIGRQSINISFVGYEDVYFAGVTLTTGAELVLNVKMTEAVNRLDEIVIKPEDV